MMAQEMTTKLGRVAISRTSSLKRFRFLFDLEGGLAFGGEFECEALNAKDAFEKLELRLPGAANHIKRVRELN